MVSWVTLFIWCEGSSFCLFGIRHLMDRKVQCLLLRVLFVWSADPKRESHRRVQSNSLLFGTSH